MGLESVPHIPREEQSVNETIGSYTGGIENISFEKWMIMGLLSILSGFFGSVPYFIFRKSNRFVVNNYHFHITMTFLSCIGAGVLLSTTIVHMLPENRIHLELTEFYINHFKSSHLPGAEIVTLIGFSIIYILEEIAHWIIHNAISNGKNMNIGHSHDHFQHDHRRHSIVSIHAASRTSIVIQEPILLEQINHSNSNNTNNTNPKNQFNINLTTNDKEFKNEIPNEDQFQESIKKNSNIIGNKTWQIGSFIALIALSFHSIMEGIAIGIQDESNIWLLFGAIASHKFLISFCMGMELTVSKSSFKVFIGSIGIFAILSPVGILIGSLLTASANAVNSLPICILEGFATGTLLYVVFMEIIGRERERRKSALEKSTWSGIVQWFGLSLGITLMTLLVTLVDHGHED